MDSNHLDQDRLFHWAWVILATCFVNVFINYSVRLGYGLALPEMIEELGLSRTAGGTIFNSYLFAYICLTPLTGYLTDRLGARRVIATCAFVLGLGTLLMGTVKTMWTACVFFAIVGLGGTGMWTPVITVAQHWFTPRRRGMALGILSTGYGLGFATMGAVFPWIVKSFDWRYSWYFLGTGALIMVIVDAVFLKSDPESAGYLPWAPEDTVYIADSDAATLSQEVSISHIFKSSTFWLIGFSYQCIAYSLYSITTFMVDYAKYQVGLSLEKASFLATIHGVAQAVGVLTILPLSDILGRRKTLILSNTLIMASIAGIIFTGESWFLLYILIGVMALFYGATFPLFGACAGDYFPKRFIGTIVGVWTPFYGLGAILANWVSGILRDTTGSYTHAFAISVGTAGIALLLIAAVKKGSEGGENRVD